MIIVGRKPVLEALQSKIGVKKILTLRTTPTKTLQEVISIAENFQIPIVTVEKKEFEEFVGKECERAQGIAAILEEFHYAAVDDILHRAQEKNEKPFIVVLDELEDPQNLGALIRTAECAGAHGVVIPKHHAASVTPAVAKASAGAVVHLPVARVTNIVQTLKELKEHGVWVIGTTMDAPMLYTAADYTDAVAIVIGNEGRGIRRLVKEHCDILVRIPMYGNVASLNASVAGALLMYEVVRARHQLERNRVGL